MRLLPILLFVSVPIWAEEPALPADPITDAIERFHSQELDEAEILLLTALETRPENAEAAYYLGRVYLDQARAEEAVASFENATRLAPQNSSYQFWLAEALVARIDQVAVLFKLGIANRIRTAYEKAVELDPENMEARIAVARYHAEAPPIAGGKPATMQEQLDEIRRRDPALAHVTQALIHERLGRIEEAEEELAESVRVDPESIVSWREIGLFHQRRQDWEHARQAFEQVLARRPKDPVALYEAARTALEISELQLAVAQLSLQTYLELEPGPPQKVFGAAEAPSRDVARQRLVRVYGLLGRPDLATLASGTAYEVRARRIDFPLVDAALVD